LYVSSAGAADIETYARHVSEESHCFIEEVGYRIRVERGDMLSDIGRRLGFGWQDIYRQNRDIIGGDPDMIFPGQELWFAPAPGKRRYRMLDRSECAEPEGRLIA
jgi:nucleoid-associated protein YgaU